MDTATLLAGIDFSRARLLGILDTIEKSGQDVQKVLAWRPGPGRAHIGWQAMHCAATHDRYLNVRIKGGPPRDEFINANFAGGSTPSDANVPTLADIRSKLESSLKDFREYVSNLTASEQSRIVTDACGNQRSVGDSIILLIWHEAHHQGQIHLTWNLYKAAHGMT
jgi:hypothetical protein